MKNVTIPSFIKCKYWDRPREILFSMYGELYSERVYSL